MIHIILCTDENYVMPCGITIFSICYNNKCNHLFFHILTEGVSSSKKGGDKISGRNIRTKNRFLRCQQFPTW